MAEGSINRDAWADVVAELIERETKGKKLPFARRVGVDATTVSRWLRRDVNVKEESVRTVAREFELPAVDLLVRVGYYEHAELTPPTYPDPREDVVIRRIMADQRLDEDQRAELVQVQIDLIEQDVKRRQAEYERLIKHQQRPAS